jgi:hypothetical protein
LSTTQEKIAVMQAHADGKQIECRFFGGDTWRATTKPSWDWSSWEYRVADDPLERALKIYAMGCFANNPEATARGLKTLHHARCKKGLEAVINAVKSGEIK